MTKRSAIQLAMTFRHNAAISNSFQFCLATHDSRTTLCALITEH
jgi:hypothetical protein